MMYLSCLVLAASCCLALGTNPFKLTNCDNSGNDDIIIESFSVSNTEIYIPGDLEAAGKINVKVGPAAGKKYDLVFDMQKEITGLGYLSVPCVQGFGSCTFDLCDFLAERYKNGCPAGFGASKLPCTCDGFKVQEYTFSKTTFRVGENLPVSVPAGNYKIQAKLLDNADQRELACINVEATVSCKGQLCNVVG